MAQSSTLPRLLILVVVLLAFAAGLWLGDQRHSDGTQAATAVVAGARGAPCSEVNQP
jgi:hypothetical protein